MARRGHALLAIQSAAADQESAAAADEIATSSTVSGPGAADPVISHPQTTTAVNSSNEPRRLIAQRPANSPQSQQQTSQFRERLLSQQYRARELFRSSWLRVPGVAPIILLADQALALIKRAQAAIERRANLALVPDAHNSDPIVDDSTLDLWLKTIDAALDSIEQQFSYFETTAGCATSLREVSQRLLTNERVSYVDLLPLAEEILKSIDEVTSVTELAPIPGVQMSSVLQGEQTADISAVYAQGVQSARFAAWSLAPRPGWRRDLPDLILAALFQDIGWLSLRPYLGDANRRGPRRVQWLSHQHPQVGAAILDGVFRIPMALPQMIAQHHERLNGSGYPRRIGLSAISRTGRVLGCISRFYELYGEMALDARSANIGLHFSRVAQGLVQEATRGWWDLEYATELVARVPRAESPAPVAETNEQASESVQTSQPNRELHGEQSELQGGHVSIPNRTHTEIGMRPVTSQIRRG